MGKKDKQREFNACTAIALSRHPLNCDICRGCEWNSYKTDAALIVHYYFGETNGMSVP